jgi:hypothetical protein
METGDTNQGLSKSQKRKAKKKQQDKGAAFELESAADSLEPSIVEVVEDEDVKQDDDGQVEGLGGKAIS